MLFEKLITIINILLINLYIYIFKFILNKKIIFAYHPRKNLTKIHIKYIENLLNDLGRDYFFLSGHIETKIKKKNFFFIKEGALKNIYNVDIFLSHNICVNFPPNCKKIYFHHDVYDSPLCSKKNEKNLFDKIRIYDYLYLANDISVKMFQELFKKYSKDNINNLPKLENAGYYKLDFLKKKINKKRSISNNVIIAITLINHIEKLSIVNLLDKLIDFLIKFSTLNIILRPHPRDRHNKIIIYLKKKYYNNNRFIFDDSDDYFRTYSNTKFLITDFSGTAYTYAFFTERPVIFFMQNQKTIMYNNFNNLNYFKDRKKIGLVVNSFKRLKYIIKNIDKMTLVIKKNNNKLQKKMIYLNKSKKRTHTLLKNIK
tara:strand:- start:1 stop:1113 length:1113 start_codon:yes stop_codon:yes gene_type:complete